MSDTVSTVWGDSRSVQLMKSIFVLRMLQEIPEPPSENSIIDFAARQASSAERVLSLKREKELVKLLTFLASAKKDPRKVMALCIEENPSRLGMTIKMAVNHGDMAEIKSSFDTMTRILERAANTNLGPTEDDYHQLLQEAVALNRNRIFACLRSRHANLGKCNYKKNLEARPKMTHQMKKVLRLRSPCHAVTRIGPFPVLGSYVCEFYKLLASLEEMSESQAESKKGLDAILVMIKTAYDIHTAGGLELYVHGPSKADLNTVKNISTTITKVSRYYSTTRLLLQAASRYPIFENINTEIVKLPPESRKAVQQQLGQRDTWDLKLEGLINDTKIQEKADSPNLRILLSRRKALKNTKKLLQDFESSRYPVHAEIQLLLHYELTNSLLPPRIISSSKEACYLCNAFFKCHGRFFIPNCHGKLYEKWTLPAAVNNLDQRATAVIKSVIAELDDIVKDKLRHALAGRTRLYSNPNESTFLESIAWSLDSQPRSERTPGSQVFPTAFEEVNVPRNDTCGRETSSDKDSISPQGLLEAEPNVADVSPATNNTISALEPFVTLQPGQSVHGVFSTTQPILRAETNNLHLSLTWEGHLDPSSPLSLKGPFSAAIKLLAVPERLVFLSTRADCPAIDVDDLGVGSELTLERNEKQKTFHISRGRDIISIDYFVGSSK